MPVTDFRTQTDRKNRKKTEGILKVLPPYMKEYLDSLDLQHKSEGTIYIYFSRDKVLFEYLGKIPPLYLTTTMEKVRRERHFWRKT